MPRKNGVSWGNEFCRQAKSWECLEIKITYRNVFLIVIFWLILSRSQKRLPTPGLESKKLNPVMIYVA